MTDGNNERGRPVTVAALIDHLTSLVEVNPGWSTFEVVLGQEEPVRAALWSGKTFANTHARTLELEVPEW